jgi:hypothetical protein
MSSPYGTRSFFQTNTQDFILGCSQPSLSKLVFCDCRKERQGDAMQCAGPLALYQGTIFSRAVNARRKIFASAPVNGQWRSKCKRTRADEAENAGRARMREWQIWRSELHADSKARNICNRVRHDFTDC